MNFLITFLETNVPSSSAKMQDLVIDCARITGGHMGKYYIGGFDSCVVVEQLFDDVFNKTLDKWNYGYEFTLTYDPGNSPNQIFRLTSNTSTALVCTGEQSAPGWLPISLFRVVPGKIILELRVCE